MLMGHERQLKWQSLIFRVLCVTLLGIGLSCRKPSENSSPANKSITSTSVDEHFRENSKGTKATPILPMNRDFTAIKLQVTHDNFDKERVADRTLSIVEWNDLKKILQKGIEVENTQLLALSAQLSFLNEKGEKVDWVSFYWTSDTGDVFFQISNQGWFKVTDRASVREILRVKAGK
jgi:hypothetical protein